MAQKITDNMKAIPIKNYDFQVDFKVDEKDVMETFLDPAENKLISVLKRPATAKAGTFGTPKVPAKKFETKEASEMNLAIKGSANPVSEGAQVASGNGSIPSNLFKFKSHLPSKKISENPKLALSMFRKKAISNKSGKTIQGNDPFSNTAGPEGFSQTGNLQRPQTAMSSQGIQGTTAMMSGLPNGNKLTVKGAAQLKEMKEKSALKSSGTAHGLFGKLPGDAEAKKQAAERPKSAIVSSAVGFMQDLKRTKKLKAPKKPEGMDDEDEEMEPAPEFSDKENSLANTKSRLDDEDKPKVRKVVAPPKKEPVKKKATEEYEEKGDDGENNGNEEEPQEEEEENNPYEKMAKKISMAKKAKAAKVEEEENAEDGVQEFPSDEEEEKEEEGEEHAEVDEDLFGNEEEDYGATESMNPSGAAKGGTKKGAKKNQENEDEEQVNEIPSYEEENQEGENKNQDEDNGENNDENGDNENNEVNNEENNAENNEENNENQEEEEQRQKDLEEEMRQSAVSGTSNTKKFRSSMANEMNELQANLLSGQDDLLSNYGGSNKGPGKTKEPAKAKKEVVEKKEKTAQDKAKDQFIKDTKKQAGGFVPYKFTNSLDGDTVQQQRDQVTDEITNYLRAADQKRQKKLEEVNKGKKKRDEEAQETNEYSSKLEILNARLKNSLQGVSKILKSSKAITSSQNKAIEVQDIDSSPEDDLE